jgi:hypothetical protein
MLFTDPERAATIWAETEAVFLTQACLMPEKEAAAVVLGPK